MSADKPMSSWTAEDRSNMDNSIIWFKKRAAVIDDIRDSMALDPDIVYTPQQIEENARRAAQARVQEEAANQLAAAGAQTAGGILETALTQQTR
jgi:hypothetical protein